MITRGEFQLRRSLRIGKQDHDMQVWRDLRSQIEHEDGLVNQRLLWMLAFSGFLFASFGYSLSAEATLVTAENGDPLGIEGALESIHWMRQAICIAGIGVGLSALFGAFAAFLAIGNAVVRFDVPNTGSFYDFPTGQKFSSITGVVAGMAFPSITICVWLFMLLTEREIFTAQALICSALGGLICLSLAIFCLWVFTPKKKEKR